MKRELRKKTDAGFTLIEMIVAVGIFMFVMVIAVGSLVAIVGADRKAESIESVVDNLRFAIDDITGTISTGTDYYCGFSATGSSDCDGGNEVTVTDQNKQRVAYAIAGAGECGSAYSGGCLMRCVYEETGYCASPNTSDGFSPVTSSEINVDADNSHFYVTGSESADSSQPRVVLVLSAIITQGISTATKLHLQTTITQRSFGL